jgi:hypothetical protein
MLGGERGAVKRVESERKRGDVIIYVEMVESVVLGGRRQ